ncbi:MAG: hypothetical protein VB096_03410 [Pseudoflavonifractor sp.]|nr:hypothetical protein [Pseudoflavonifractor sp.]
MPLQQGVAPFVFVAAFLAVGLLIAWVFSIRMDASRAQIYERIGNAIALLGFLLGFQFRLSEYLYGESHFGRTDSLPGPVVIVLMLGLYVPLRFLVTSYTQYRKNRDDEQLAQTMMKEAIGSFIALIVIFTLTIFMEFL